jgi:hypothetical protein
MNTSNIIALSSVIIALSSLFLSIVTLRRNRIHQILSVKPLCSILIKNYENEIGLYIQNNGIGPLIIENVVFTNVTGQTSNNILVFIPDGEYADYTEDFIGKSILPGGRIVVFVIGGKGCNINRNKKDKLRKNLTGMEVSVLYRDVYGLTEYSAIRKRDYYTTKNNY